MNEEIFLIGLIAFAAITVFEVMALRVVPKLPPGLVGAQIEKFTILETVFLRSLCPRTLI